jgi:hypothetical protein
MRKESLLMVGIFFLLVMGIVSAGLLDYYGLIKGTADVEGPTFYASSSSIGGIYYQLLINTPPSDGELDLTDGNVIIFASDSLNVDNWYSADWKTTVNVGTNKVGNKLTIQLWVLDQNYGGKTELCSQTITLDSVGNKTYQITCSLGSLTLDPTDRLGLRIGGWGVDSTYMIKVEGTTRSEVSV